MNNTTDNDNYKKFIILYVDDEENSLESLKIALDDTFKIMTATNAEDGLRILREHQDDIGVLMTDQRMPGESGTEFLEKARALQPGIMRILVTAYADISAAIDAVNSGAIYKYVSKPWDVRELEITLKRALEYFLLQRERDELLRDKLSVTYSMVIADRIMMLGLIGAGLTRQFRNAPAAVRSYLDFVGHSLQRDSITIEQLKEVSVWERFHRRASADAETLALVLEKLPIEPRGETRKCDVVASALEAANKANLTLVTEGAENRPTLDASGGQVEQMFQLLWKTLEVISAKECKLSSMPKNVIVVTSTLDHDAQRSHSAFSSILLHRRILNRHQRWAPLFSGLSCLPTI